NVHGETTDMASPAASRGELVLRRNRAAAVAAIGVLTLRKLSVFAASRETAMTENEISKEIVDVAYKIHTAYGPGLLESVYETIMSHERNKRDLRVVRQQAIPVIHEAFEWNLGFVRI